jgi:hypothetical protein
MLHIKIEKDPVEHDHCKDGEASEQIESLNSLHFLFLLDRIPA